MTARAKIALIDYGSGNLRSVAKALEAVGAEIQQIESGPIPDGFDALVLPGVGAFGDSVRQLQERGLFRPIREWLDEPEESFSAFVSDTSFCFKQARNRPELKVLDSSKAQCSDSGLPI